MPRGSGGAISRRGKDKQGRVRERRQRGPRGKLLEHLFVDDPEFVVRCLRALVEIMSPQAARSHQLRPGGRDGASSSSTTVSAIGTSLTIMERIPSHEVCLAASDALESLLAALEEHVAAERGGV